MKSTLEKILDFKKSLPNDQEFGEKIRELLEGKLSKSNMEILFDMHLNDISMKTDFVGVCPECISVDKVKGGNAVKMAAPENLLLPLTLGDKVPFLFVVDREEFEKRQQNN